jgi:predicted SnoaL-like aldol condensation-catalyzing enzyme
MKGDFSRVTFDKEKHYCGVLMQQGRVQLDSDWNEQQEITQYRAETEATDTVGRSGVPKVNGGFCIDVAGNGEDLTVSKGRMYVDGLLCENDRDNLTFLTQDDYPAENPEDKLVGFKKPDQKGRYVVFLDVWKHSVTCIEDPHIREKALGGPDTTTRSKIIWQVKLDKVDDNALCAHLDGAWKPQGCTGKLTAHVAAGSSESGPCKVIPPAGYQGLDNHLYRIEIHQGGSRSEATFKWSRDNGSVVRSVKEISGQRISLEVTSKDDQARVSECDWVEIMDDRMELVRQRGVLLKLKPAGLPGDRLEIDPVTPIPPLDKQKNRKLRWWDHRNSNATPAGIPMSAERIKIENGIEVQFSNGTYRQGDYWLIAARAAMNGEQGNIEWRRDEEEKPAAQFPQGLQHHYCALALVDFDGRRFARVTGGDCRKLFPPLTAITASDVSFDNDTCSLPGVSTVQDALDALCRRGGQCTVLIGPKEPLDYVLKQIDRHASVQVCFQAGEYHLDRPFILKGAKGRHIRVTGCGPATRIMAPQTEAAMVFQDWESVSLENLGVEAGVATHTANFEPPLNGALTFRNCNTVSVEKVSALCGSGPRRRVACISVANEAPQTFDQTMGSVRICRCDLRPGDQQIGIMVTNAGRVYVEGNTVEPNSDAGGVKLADLLKDRGYRGAFTRRLMKNALVDQALPEPERVTRIRYKGCTVSMVTTEGLGAAWQKLVSDEKPEGINSPQALRDFVKDRADKIITDEGKVEGNQPFADWYQSMKTKYPEIGHGRMSDETRAKIRRELVSLLRSGVWQTPEKGCIETITHNTFTLRFETDRSLVGHWQSLLKEADIEKISKPQALVKYMRKALDRVLQEGLVPARFPELRVLLEELSKGRRAVAAQGIVLAGSFQHDVRIINNSLSGVHQGIHIGLSHKDAPRNDHDSIERSVISGNSVFVTPAFGATLQAHGAFVGNCRSAIIENNFVVIRVPIKTYKESVQDGRAVEGIRVFGILGPMIVIRQNHIQNATVGIHVRALGGSDTAEPQWLAGDNITKGAEVPLIKPAAMRNVYTHS